MFQALSVIAPRRRMHWLSWPLHTAMSIARSTVRDTPSSLCLDRYCEVMAPVSAPPFATIATHRAGVAAAHEPRDVIVLERAEWNDWFRWRTLFSVSYFDKGGRRLHVGAVKIAKLDHAYANEAQHATPIPDSFTSLDHTYVSVGQDEGYYDNLKKWLGASRARETLVALRDLAVRDSELPDADVVVNSLLRNVAEFTVHTTFANIVRGIGYSPYSFTYTRPKIIGNADAEVKLTFNVEPDAKPPTNVHALIGPNGSGKTTHLRNMAIALLGPEAGPSSARLSEGTSAVADFANLVYVSFSAFDDQKITSDLVADTTQYLPTLDDEQRFQVRYSYVGLLRGAREVDPDTLEDSYPPRENLTSPRQTLTSSELSTAFIESAWVVFQEKSRTLWVDAVASLESDLYFQFADAKSLMDVAAHVSMEEFFARARSLITPMSSGHKIVLLAITRLVQTLTERTLVLIDEPESHLHPPLLAAYIRTLSHLMTERNAVAIVSTHSPVVLQEIPRSCVNRVTRQGATQLAQESFGESVGVLTSSVFGLEVEDSGFHKMLVDRATSLRDFDAVLREFDGQLGSEARALLAAWLADQGTDTRSHADRRTW
jgi:ABC-type transport system involved in cytochrome c biogenesis ATPase subunit